MERDEMKLAPAGIAWSQVKAWNSLVFVSGQVAWDEDGQIQGASASEQADVAFRNVEAALKSAGSAMGNVLKVTIYCVDPADISDIRSVRDKWLEASAPASTFIIAGGLVEPGLLVEVEAIGFV